jgi:hypothetical protein
MIAAVEHIKQEIRNLAPEEVDQLLRDLQNEYSMPMPDGEDEADVEAAWDAEIEARVKEVEEGKVELISYAELRKGTDALLAELGIKRPV